MADRPEPRELSFGVVDGEGEDMGPGMAGEEPIERVGRERWVDDRDQFDIALPQHRAAVARAERSDNAVRPGRVVLRVRAQREAEPLVGGGENAEVAPDDSDMVERCRGHRRQSGTVSYFAARIASGSAAASSYQRATSGWARMAAT